ncbi:hypothetical protein P8452_57891 [Trifolium repens]|nr:hypothetical protein P8452_57891 [Trifolium repens]
MVEISDGFSFGIEDNPGERTIQLTRKYEDDTNTVQVEIPTVWPGQNEDDDVDDNKKNDSESSIPLVVNVFKGNGDLEFVVTTFSDEMNREGYYTWEDHTSSRTYEGTKGGADRAYLEGAYLWKITL